MVKKLILLSFCLINKKKKKKKKEEEENFLPKKDGLMVDGPQLCSYSFSLFGPQRVQSVFKGVMYDHSRNWKRPLFHRESRTFSAISPHPILREIKETLPKNIPIYIFMIWRTHFHFTPLSLEIENSFYKDAFEFYAPISQGREDTLKKKKRRLIIENY